MDKNLSHNKSVALDPFNHLLSVDLDESSPVRSTFCGGDNSTTYSETFKKQSKKVRFSDICSESTIKKFGNDYNSGKSFLKKLKGILKSSSFTTENLNASNSSFEEEMVGGSDSNDNSVCMKESILMEISTEQLDNDVTNEILRSENAVGKCIEIFHEQSERAINVNETSNNLECPIAEVSEVKESDINSENVKVPMEEVSEGDLTDKLNNLVLFRGAEDFQDHEKGNEVRSSDNCEIVDEVKKISKDLFLETVNRLRNDRIRQQCTDYKGQPHVFTETSVLHENRFSQDVKKSASSVENPSDLKHLENEFIPEVPGMFQKFPQTIPHGSKNLRIKRPFSPLTLRMKDIVEKRACNTPTGKELRSIVFSAWCTVKGEDLKVLKKKSKTVASESKISTTKEKALKEAASQKAFMYWKEQKERIIKKRKAEEMKLARSKLLKAQQDKKNQKEETELVFRAWKQKKDKQLREQLWKQSMSARNEKLYRKRAEEMKEEDAEAAFNAWKSQKALELEEKQQVLQMKEEEELQKSKERAQRDSEALEAYENWLEFKEQNEGDFDWGKSRLMMDKPPWNPPGKVS